MVPEQFWDVKDMAAKNPGLDLNHKSGIPLYIQLKQQISTFISAQVWEPGFKLPTERELAASLGISRNTVSAAYKELEIEGLLVSLQGRGTFVAGDSSEKEKPGRKSRLLKVIDLALGEAAKLGFGPDDFLSLATARALEQKESLAAVNLAFVGTSQEQISYFQRELLPQTGVKIAPFFMQEIRNNPQAVQETLASFDLVVTTFPEVDELQHLLQPFATSVLGVALDLELETIVQIARLPKHSTLALITSSDAFASKVEKSLHHSGINGLNIVRSTENSTSLDSIIAKADAIAVSSERAAEVLSLVQERDCKEIIELLYRIDQGSLNMLHCYLMDLKNKT